MGRSERVKRLLVSLLMLFRGTPTANAQSQEGTVLTMILLYYNEREVMREF